MDACASSLIKTRDFLKEKLPYLKEIAKDIDGTGKKGKPAAAAQPNLPGNNNNTAGGVPNRVVKPKLLLKRRLTNPFSIDNAPGDVDAWIKGGRKAKYNLRGTIRLFDVFDKMSWRIVMPTAGLVLPKGILPKEADVEKAVRANVLKVKKNGNEYYVVLVVEQTKNP